jgi:hypothetical protein
MNAGCVSPGVDEWPTHHRRHVTALRGRFPVCYTKITGKRNFLRDRSFVTLEGQNSQPHPAVKGGGLCYSRGVPAPREIVWFSLRVRCIYLTPRGRFLTLDPGLLTLSTQTGDLRYSLLQLGTTELPTWRPWASNCHRPVKSAHSNLFMVI